MESSCSAVRNRAALVALLPGTAPGEEGDAPVAGPFIGRPDDWRRLSETWPDPDLDEPDIGFEVGSRLVDYVSAGHFEVYDQLVREAEAANDNSVKHAEELYPKLHTTTQVALDFNDKYSTEENWENNQSDFQEDLSKLGEELSHRFEMEDQLISEMHSCHSDQLAPAPAPARQKSLA